MKQALQIGAYTFDSVQEAVKHFELMQGRMLSRREMLQPGRESPEDMRRPGDAFEAIAMVYLQYLQLTNRAMPEPAGFYTRYDYPVKPATGDRFPVMAAYFADNTEHIFNIGHAIKTVTRAVTRHGRAA